MDEEEYEYEVELEDATWQDLFLDEAMMDQLTVASIEAGLDLNQPQLRAIASVIIPAVVGRAMSVVDEMFVGIFGRDADEEDEV